MLKFYFNGAPNPNKVALFLEESGLAYEPVPVDTRKGDQFKPEFLKVNPNGKVPAIDDDGVFVFDSNAILLYLAEKTGKFLPPSTPDNRAQLLSWLMFVASGVGPYSGQAVHFKHFAPEELEYANNRYQFEAHRHYGSSTSISPAAATWSATPTPSSTWRSGAGRGWCRSCWATTPSRNTQRQAPARRDLGAAGGGAGDRAEGQVHLQDRDGRRGAQHHVPPSQDQGGVSSVTTGNSRYGKPRRSFAVLTLLFSPTKICVNSRLGVGLASLSPPC